MDARSRRVFSVSEFTILVRESLERQFPDVWIEGEISNLRAPGSGHLYFTLKDQAAQIRSVLFRSQAQRIRFSLKEGLAVLVRGRLSVYEPRGEYQLILDAVEPKGLGALQLAFEQLKERLEREGLFDPAKKRPLPFLPRCVGIVTSPTGAAIRDMLAVLGRRCPLTHVLLCPVAVQGDGAAEQIARGIALLSESRRVDVIIIGRGGGSLEDLWAFNEEVVVRAIAASSVPVVSAVGHEIDFTLADFAADYRAPTPSAAAETVVPVLEDLSQALRELTLRQRQAVRSRLRLVRQELALCQGALAGMLLRIQREAQRLDEAGAGLAVSTHRLLAGSRNRIMLYRQRLDALSPRARLHGALVLVQQLKMRADQKIRGTVTLRRQSALALAGSLHDLSPLAVLSRGYSIVQKMPGGEVVKRSGQVSAGEDVLATLASGRLVCTVRHVSSNDGQDS